MHEWTCQRCRTKFTCQYKSEALKRKYCRKCKYIVTANLHRKPPAGTCKCLHCGHVFTVKHPSHLKFRKYCQLPCYWEHKSKTGATKPWSSQFKEMTALALAK